MPLRDAAVVLALLLTVSGCAGRSTRSNLARIQSQVGLLDERVTQLEHSGWSASGTSGYDATAAAATAAADATGGTLSAASASDAGRVKVSSKSSASGKPTTRQIQQALRNAGFYQGNVDGKMGPLTRQAVEEFQRINGLTPDGVVGRKTWEKLRTYAELSESSGATALK